MVRIAVVVTARPSYSRVRSLLLALHAMPDVELQVIACASTLLDRYGAVVSVMQADGLPITERIYSVVEGENLETSAKSTGLLLMELSSTFRRLQPDLVVVNADRFEVLAAAQAARYSEIPLAHLQGGECTGSVDDAVRNAITQLADVHLVSTPNAATRVMQMRGSPSGVFLTGCPSLDLCVGLEHEPSVTAQELGGAGAPIDLERPFVVLLNHPTTDAWQEAYDEMAAAVRGCLLAGVQVLAFWPGNEAGAAGSSKVLREYQDCVHTVRNLPPRVFLKVLTQAASLVGDSSVGIREASYLGVPVVNLGRRQHGRERAGNVVDVLDYEPHAIHEALKRQIAAGFYPKSTLYGDGAAGQRMADVLVEVAHERVSSHPSKAAINGHPV